MQHQIIDTLAKGAFGMGTISAVNSVPTPSADTTDTVLKAALQIIIAIVTLISVWKKPKSQA